ncbi:protein HEG isoform X1 [Paramisgurnus dabryanus]|uniref:protein HEG isoform X1 n=1 Tax=Paramisgurnus dabryanus TaxID=90735 RepID=UPI0031F4242C
METCARRRAHRVAFTLFLLVLRTAAVKSFTTETDTDNPLSTETFSNTTSVSLKQTTSRPDGDAVVTTAEEMTDIPASVSTTGARTGHTEKTSHISTNTADWTTRMTSTKDGSTKPLISNKEVTHNATADWKTQMSSKKDGTTKPLLSNKEVTHNATADWTTQMSSTKDGTTKPLLSNKEVTHNATADWTTQMSSTKDGTTKPLLSNKEVTHNATADWTTQMSSTKDGSTKPLLSNKKVTHNATAGWTSQMTSTKDGSTKPLQSNKEVTHNTTARWEGTSEASYGSSSSPSLIEERNLVTETRTVRDIPVTDLRKHYVDTDSTDSVSHTDSTYISTTSRVGERTLLSVTSNSTSSYTNDSSTSEDVSLTSSWEERTPGSTHGQARTVQGGFTASGGHNITNATHGQFLETEEPQVSQGTESHTRQPFVTEPDDNLNSTLPFTAIDDGKAETSVISTSSETSYTETSGSVSSMPPYTHNVSSTSQDKHETTVTDTMDTGSSTEFSTGSVSSSSQEDPKGTSDHTMEDTTIQGLTTATPTFNDVATTTDDSFTKFLTQRPRFFPKTDDPTSTEVLSTSAIPTTQKPQLTEETTYEASTANSATNTPITGTAPVTTRQLQPSTPTPAETKHTTPATTVQVLQTTSSTTQHLPTSHTSRPHAPSTSDTADVTTLHLETSTATPGNTTGQDSRATTPYSKNTPTKGTIAFTTKSHTDKGTTEMGMTTTQMPSRTTSSPGHVCSPDTNCSNGGKCVKTAEGHHCQCLPAWTGPSCTEDVDECVSSPCPQGSKCINTGGSFSCECDLGFDLEDGRSCTQVKTFLGTFTVNNSMQLKNSNLHDLQREILQLLNASLSIFHGYRRTTLSKKDGEGVQMSAVNMFLLSTNVTSSDIYNRIQMSLNNCSRTYSHCTIKLQHQLSYHAESLCLAKKPDCELQHSECTDVNGTPYCQCHPGYFKKNPGDTTCRDCGDGLQLVNGNCVECMFGFGGFNCSNFYKLIAVVVSPASGALLLIVIIALIVTCCKKDKNDINKIIFKSGELQMSPYAEFPKSNRVSMEWGRETIEMQENGSTKNLLQMTDIYYSAALRNSDLERNGLYPFSGLPGSRHSCIYPAQWNPSFISDDSRRRDYF